MLLRRPLFFTSQPEPNEAVELTSLNTRCGFPQRHEEVALKNSARYDDFPDGVVVAGSAGQVLEVNEAAGRLLAMPPNRAVGRDFRDVLPFVDIRGVDWWKQANPYARRATQSRQQESLLILCRGPRCGDQLLVTAQCVRKQGSVVRLVISLRSTQARHSDLDPVDVVTTLAHEIRSPVATVRGFTSTLLEKWDYLTDEQRRIMLESVHTDADRIARLMSDLLAASRIKAHDLPLRRQPVNMLSLVRSIVDGLVAAGQPRDQFLVHCSDLLPELWLDSDKVAQILWNLIGNALDHGASPVTISVGSMAPRGQAVAVVTVSDSGPGIPPELRELVFSRFWHGAASQGTGLGLYIVKGLAQAHGGSVELVESPTGGATFQVLLPAVPLKYPEPRPPHDSAAAIGN